MAIFIHVLIALGSIGVTTVAFVAPSIMKLRIAYGMVAATFISGTYLVVDKQAHLLATCETGVVYLGFMLVAILAARYRLATAKQKIK